MAIVKMKKLRLLTVRSQQEALLRELMLLGCVEVSEPKEPGEDEASALSLTRETSDLTKARTDQTALSQALRLLDQYAPVKSGLFAHRPVVREEDFLEEAGIDGALETAKRIGALDERIRRATAEESRLRSLIDSLRPWEALDLPLETAGTRTCAAILGSVPTTTDPLAMEQALSDAVEESQIVRVSDDAQQHCMLIVCLKEKQPEVMDVLRANGFTPASLGGMTGTAKENIAAAERRLAALGAEKTELAAKLAAEGETRAQLKLCSDRLTTRIDRAQTTERLLASESVSMLTGWVTEPGEAKLVELLNRFDCAYELTEPTEEEYADVPVLLRNNKLSEPLSMVTEMYSLPKYGTIDPNPLIMPFFTMFFGIMYADLGYGIVLFLLSLIVRKKAELRGTLKYMFELMTECSIWIMVFGLLTGGFFGDAITTISGMLGHEVTSLPGPLNLLIHPLVAPMKDPLTVLILAMAIGCVQLLTGMGIKAYLLCRDGHPLDALMDIGSWWLLFAGIAVGALGKGWAVAIAGAAALILTQGRAKKGIFGKLFGGVGSLYNITSYFGDVLSYARLMTLLLAGSVIASIVNMLGALTGSIVSFLLIFLIGHVFNMGINIIGTYVHSARLQYLEYFNKFYEDGGRPFRPLRIDPKYVNILKEEK